jgi:hypothetical protein
MKTKMYYNTPEDKVHSSQRDAFLILYDSQQYVALKCSALWLFEHCLCKCWWDTLLSVSDDNLRIAVSDVDRSSSHHAVTVAP